MSKDQQQPQHALSRRDAVRRLAGAGLSFALAPVLAACAASGSSSSRSAIDRTMPTPDWPAPRRNLRFEPAPSRTAHVPARPSGPSLPDFSGVRARSGWSNGEPVPSLMDRMLPIRRITLHHDGMNAFTSTAPSAASARIEAIRSAHRGRGWGDIGYHYALDPAGRVWAARPLDWQGAHVRDQNQGNIGICVLGNYDKQRPTQNQLESLEHFVAQVMQHYDIPVTEVYTHRELASTACPGRHLQPRLVAMRDRRGSLARA